MQRLTQTACRQIGILRQQQGAFTAGVVDVRLVDTRIGADDTQAVAHDDYAGGRTHHCGGFTQDQFHQAGVLVDLPGETDCGFRRIDIVQQYLPPFRFGDDFLGKNQDIPIDGLNTCTAQGFHDHLDKIVAGFNQRNILQWMYAQARIHSDISVSVSASLTTRFAAGNDKTFTIIARRFSLTSNHSSASHGIMKI